MSTRLRLTCAALAVGVLLAQELRAATPRDAVVEFTPDASSLLQSTYGADEVGVLRTAILEALTQEAGRGALPAGLTLRVTVQQVVPTHPTMKQQLDTPSLDPVRTRYLGGADLLGEIRDANQQVLATVGYRHFAASPALGSYSWDAWGDARIAIDGFAAKMASTLKKFAKS